jgi:hypothetical protein
MYMSLETANLFVEKYPWLYLPTTVHKILIHELKLLV